MIDIRQEKSDTTTKSPSILPISGTIKGSGNLVANILSRAGLHQVSMSNLFGWDDIAKSLEVEKELTYHRQS